MGGTRRILAILVALVATLGGVAASAPAVVADTGREGFSYAPLTDPATGSKPQSKLWYADGAWWATMFRGSSHRIFRLDRGAQTWTDTGTQIDTRRDTRADTLWDGASGKLYVASHPFSGEKTGEGPAASGGGKLWRFSYAGGQYTLDPGFPAVINRSESETLTIDRDSTGTLWATWVQGSQVMVSRTAGGDATWVPPYAIPGAPTNLSVDDISSVVAFGQDRVGVMFSNETDKKTYFATHGDGAADSAWSVATVPTGLDADDHINLKADGSGRVFAATKASNTSGTQPLVQLMVRSSAGAWSRHEVGQKNDHHTRPIVQLDEAAGTLQVIMTCGESGGPICRKTTSMDAPSFARGSGETIIEDSDGRLNDATSTKQNLGAAGLVVMAHNQDTNLYWHRDFGSSVAPAPVRAEFTSTPAGGPAAPVTVAFRDASTGSPTSWRWDFGDGTGSTARNPSHTYTEPGSYTVTLTAANATSSDTRPRAGAVVVGGGGAPGGGTPGGGTTGGGTTGGGTTGGGTTGGGTTGGGTTGGGTTAGPGGGVLGTTSIGRRISVTLRVARLSGGRVRLSGSTSVRLSRVRVSLEVRGSSGRYRVVRRATLLPLRGGKSRYAFVLRRPSRTTRYRIVVPSSADRPRAVSRSLRLAGARR